nr:ribonuclease H-like domain-containing protein [Tanacetum cinerariifolium]
MMLAKKDKDEQVLLAEDQAWMELNSDSDQEINANMVFMAQIEKVLSDSESSSSSADEKIYEVMKSSTSNVETPINEEVFHEVSKSFQGESFSSSLNDDVQQSPEEVILPQTNTQSIPINMVPNGDEASTSHNVFNERLEDAYFDVSTSFHDPSNVQNNYQPYPHEKKWTKDHPLHKIIGDPKSSVRTKGQLENSCLFSCLLSSIEPANVAKALRDADWVSAMQEELDQFARLKDFTVFQMDVKTVFLNGILKEEVYISQPLAESEYVSVSGCCAQVLWMRNQLMDYGFFYDKVPIYCYSKSAIAISCNPVQHTQTKHIDVRTGIDLPRSLPYHFGKLGLEDIVNGLPKLRYVNDQLCSSCELGKAKRITFNTKIVLSFKERLNLLHTDLCGPMRIESINGKKYILVIVDDYSRYTWTRFLRTEDETQEVLKDFLKMIDIC